MSLNSQLNDVKITFSNRYRYYTGHETEEHEPSINRTYVIYEVYINTDTNIYIDIV